MDYATIEKTVNLICEKLGMTANEVGELIPKLAEYKIAMGWVTVGVAVFCFALIALMVWKGEWICEQDLEFIAVTLGVICSIIGVFCLIWGIVNIVSWGAIPEIKAVEYFLANIA